MTIDNDDLLNSIMASLGRIETISLDEIPNIDLYMDQLTSFMDERLKKTTRYPGEDKILTKTMINNYAKNKLLPPPDRKKYDKDHMIMLLFIYYFKGFLSINDIEKLMHPLSERYFHSENGLTLQDIYGYVMSASMEQVEPLQEFVRNSFKASESICDEAAREGASEKDREFLKLFSFICSLSFDVYVKRLMIEKLIDLMPDPDPK